MEVNKTLDGVLAISWAGTPFIHFLGAIAP